MKVTYLGTGAAEGIPALFCNCKNCRAAREKREFRSRSQVIIDGELSIELPPDSFYHAAIFGADLSAVKYLLVTHSHMDHFHPQDLVLRGYKYAADMTSPTVELYGNEEVNEVYREYTRREMKEVVSCNIRPHTVRTFEEFTFGNWRAHALKAKHNSKEPLLFALEKGGKSILHLTDTGILPGENYAYLAEHYKKPFDLVTIDCTFLFGETVETSRHMGLEENKATFLRLRQLGLVDGATKKVITHFSHNSDPSAANLRRAEEEYGVIAAYDGMTLEI